MTLTLKTRPPAVVRVVPKSGARGRSGNTRAAAAAAQQILQRLGKRTGDQGHSGRILRATNAFISGGFSFHAIGYVRCSNSAASDISRQQLLGSHLGPAGIIFWTAYPHSSPHFFDGIKNRVTMGAVSKKSRGQCGWSILANSPRQFPRPPLASKSASLQLRFGR